MRKRTRITLGALAVTAALAGGVAWATIPGDGGVYTACKLNATGTIRLIDPSLAGTSLLGRCTAAETQVTWNQRGVKGDPGAAGTNGVDGAAGATGAKGDTGAAGKDGAPGAKGDTGAAGVNGANGVDGNAGAPGAKGDAGQAGKDGIDGATGARGPAGPSSPATRTVTTIAPQDSLVGPHVFGVVSTSAVFGEFTAECRVDARTGISRLLLYLTNTTAGDSLSAASGPYNAGTGLLPGVRTSLDSQQAFPASALVVSSYTIMRYTTDASGTPSLSSERVSMAFDVLADGSCLVATVASNDE